MKLTIEQVKAMGYDVSPLYGTTKIILQPPASPKLPKRIRQSSKPLMNKLESEFFEFLKNRYDDYQESPILCQSVRFKLGNGIWYKPDFFVHRVETAYEVKGPHAFRGGLENLKVAAHLYTFIRWVMVWKEDGRWQEQEVLA